MFYLKRLFGHNGRILDFLTLNFHTSGQVGMVWTCWLFSWEEYLFVFPKFCSEAFC